MKYRIIEVNYEPESLRAPMYIAMYKEYWWSMWKGFRLNSGLTTYDMFFVEKFPNPEEALKFLKLRLKTKEMKAKYPRYKLLEQGKL